MGIIMKSVKYLEKNIDCKVLGKYTKTSEYYISYYENGIEIKKWVTKESLKFPQVS
jgi:hypothetical protein